MLLGRQEEAIIPARKWGKKVMDIGRVVPELCRAVRKPVFALA
jgi:hypothetical protein